MNIQEAYVKTIEQITQSQNDYIYFDVTQTFTDGITDLTFLGVYNIDDDNTDDFDDIKNIACVALPYTNDIDTFEQDILDSMHPDAKKLAVPNNFDISEN